MEVCSDLYVAKKAKKQNSNKQLFGVESHQFQELMVLETCLP